MGCILYTAKPIQGRIFFQDEFLCHLFYVIFSVQLCCDVHLFILLVGYEDIC